MTGRENGRFGEVRADPVAIPRREWILVAALASFITLVMQPWVGSLTIYADQMHERREVLHEAILHNTPPPGRTWNDIGGNGVNIRVGTVYLAEGLRHLTGSLTTAYFALDTAALWTSLLLLYAYLRRWMKLELTLVGVLYFAACLPLTYLFHYFHPWDRLSLVTWLALLLAMAADRRWLLVLLLPFAITIKYDVVPFGLLYAAAYWNRDREAAVQVGLVLTLEAFATVTVLMAAFPGGFFDRPPVTLFADNLHVLLETGLGYPPLLALGPLIACGYLGWSDAPPEMRAAAGFALVVCALLFFQVHFVEVRALTPLMVLLLPCALVGLQRLFPNGVRPA